MDGDCAVWRLQYLHTPSRLEIHLLTVLDSETAFPVDSAIQIYAPVWCRDA